MSQNIRREVMKLKNLFVTATALSLGGYLNAATLPAGSYDDLKASATINDSALVVNSMEGGSVDSSNEFSLNREDIDGDSFAEINNSLSGLLDITLTAINNTTNGLNKNVLVTVLFKKGSTYVAAATEATF
jgi:hypothetical protein